MSNVHTLTRRVARLEGAGAHIEIPVWCDDPEDLAGTMDAMLKRGEIEPRDVPRCVFWSDANTLAGYHEAALAELDRTP
jgi:hypothetical protein